MASNIVTVNSRKYDGSLHRTWNCELVKNNGEYIELIGRFEETIVHADLGTIGAGTSSHEIYWFNEYYSIFIFTRPNGELRNYYCNINKPATFDNGIVEYIDLDIDVLVDPDLSYRVLDVHEFEENSARFGYEPEILSEVEKALKKIELMISRREFPFNKGHQRG